MEIKEAKRKSEVEKQHQEEEVGPYQVAGLGADEVVGLLQGALAGSARVDRHL